MEAVAEAHLIKSFAEKYATLSPNAIKKIASLGKIVQLKKKEHFIQYGKIDKQIGFVISGIFRGYLLNNGEETTLWFSNELDIMASYSGILLQESSKITYQALEDAFVFVVNYSDLKEVAKQDKEIAHTLIQMLEQLLGEAYQRNERFILMDATARYLDLLERKPNVVNRVSQKLLASYIGITPVSLSRLRSKIK